MTKHPALFLLRAAARQMPVYFGSIVREILGRKASDRTPEKVRASYDAGAERKLEFLRSHLSISLSEYVFDAFLNSPEEQYGFRLINDLIVWQSERVAWEALASAIEDQLRPYLVGRGTIVEFGSGTGRNLLWLKSKYPQIKFIGLELSPKNVELSRFAAKRFGLEASFFEANVCGKIPDLPKDVLTVFSVHSLEQMSGIFGSAVANMMSLTPEQAFFFEPAGELYPLNFRGLVSRMRIRCINRLIGLKKYLTKQYRLVIARRLGIGVNPLNESCVLVAERII